MIKLTAGFSRKVGEANYSSRGASVNLEMEVESSTIDSPDRMHHKIKSLFALARKAVDEELKNGHAETATKDDATTAKVMDTDGPVCAECGTDRMSEKVIKFSTEKFNGRVLCYRCQKSLNWNGGN